MAPLITIKTRYGAFEVNPQEYRVNDDGDGVTVRLRFVAGSSVDASVIALVQIANSIIDDRPEAINNSAVIRHHSIPVGEPGAGFHIDQDPANRNPVFAVDSQPAGNDDLAAGIPLPFFGEFGSRPRGGPAKPASLYDLTHLVDARPGSEQRFETCALALKGPQAGTFYGSVSWGWKMDANRRVQPYPIALVSPDAPSAVFVRAAGIWNGSTTSNGEPTIALPVGTPAGDAAETEDQASLDLSKLTPGQLEELAALVESLIAQQRRPSRPTALGKASHSSHSQG